MNNNTPTLMQSEKARAPWNERIKKITVTISQTLSLTTELEVPIDFDEFDNKALEEVVKEHIELPSEAIQNDEWIVDDFCVM